MKIYKWNNDFTVYILIYLPPWVVLTLLQSSLVMLPPVVILLAVLSESVGLTLMTSMGIPRVEAHTCITWNQSSFEFIWSCLCSQATSYQLHKHVSGKHVHDVDSNGLLVTILVALLCVSYSFRKDYIFGKVTILVHASGSGYIYLQIPVIHCTFNCWRL